MDEAAYVARYPFQEYGAGIWGTEARLRTFLEETRKRGFVEWQAPNARFLVGAPVYSKEGALNAGLLTERQLAALTDRHRLLRVVFARRRRAHRIDP